MTIHIPIRPLEQPSTWALPILIMGEGTDTGPRSEPRFKAEHTERLGAAVAWSL